MAPWEGKEHHFHFVFQLNDRPANDAAGWVLDEVQRHKLVELQAHARRAACARPRAPALAPLALARRLARARARTLAVTPLAPAASLPPCPPPQALLGLSDSLWTPVGVLGFVLAAASCAQLEELAFFKDLLRSVREAHRDEVLEGGSM